MFCPKYFPVKITLLVNVEVQHSNMFRFLFDKLKNEFNQQSQEVFPLTVTGTVFGLSQGWLQLISDPLGLFPLMIKTLFTETQHSVNINPPDLNCHSVTLVFFYFQS